MVKRTVLTMEINGRKPVRPVERQRMRPWIWTQLDEGTTPGLSWFEKSKGIFKISWRHAARHGYNAKNDADLFCKWALHTGRVSLGDHKKWKANFRCALNSLPDVVELKKLGVGKGSNAYRVFQFLDEKKEKKRQKSYTRAAYVDDVVHDSKEESQVYQDSDSDGERVKNAVNDNLESPSDDSQSDSDMSMDQTSSSECEGDPRDLPAFEKICPSLASERVTKTLPKHFSGCNFVRRSSTGKDDTDDSLSTTSSAMTDDEVVQLVLDAELTETDCTDYDPDIWNGMVAQEVITDENGTTYIMLTDAAQQPVVTIPGTDTDHYDITNLSAQ